MPKIKFDIEKTFKKHVEQRISEISKQLPIQKNDMELTAATRLLEKRKEIQDAEINLTQQKEEYTSKSDAMSQRREELVKRELQLKDALLKFEKFLKENDSKKARAYKKSTEEKKVKEMKEKEIIELINEFKVMIEKKDVQVQQIDQLMKYHSFLEHTLEHLPDYGDIRDIISRHETLKQTNTELLSKSTTTGTEIEQHRETFKSINKNKQTIILNYKNSLAKYQAEVEDLQGKRIKAQTKLQVVIDTNQEKSLMSSQIKMSVTNIFGVVQSHLNNKIPPHVDSIDQLDEIKGFYCDMNQIVNELLKDPKKENSQ